MKVTRHGDTYSEAQIKTEVDCHHCGAGIEEITEADIEKDLPAGAQFVHCPECGGLIDVSL